MDSGINTIEEAKKACRAGAYAAVVSGIATTGLVLIATRSSGQGGLQYYSDPLLFLDAGLIFLLAIGMYRYSRAAAVVACCYFLLSKIVVTLDTGEFRGGLLAIIFIYFFGKAAIGAFAYHKMRKIEDPEYRPAARWMYWLGIPAGVVAFSLMAFGIYLEVVGGPEVEVIEGAQVPETDQQWLVTNEVLFEDEEIVYFYSYGLTSIADGGNVLTNRAIVTYFIDENGDTQVYEMPFADVVSVFRIEEGSYLTDSIYRVASADPDYWITIELSIENSGDEVFVSELRKMVRESKRQDVESESPPPQS